MPLVKAKCTNCGGTLQVDSEKKAAICPYCKEAYVVEEAINNYVTYNNTYNTTNVEHLHADVVQVADDRNAQARMEAGKTFLKLGQYAAAKSAFEEASRLTPQNYLCWWGQIQADITAGELINRNDYRYQNALKTAPAETVPQLEKAFQAHIEAYNKRAREAREQQEADNLAEWDRCRATARELISRLDPMIDVLSRKAEEYKKKAEHHKSKLKSEVPMVSKLLMFLSIICFLAAPFFLFVAYASYSTGYDLTRSLSVAIGCLISGTIMIGAKHRIAERRKFSRDRMDQKAHYYFNKTWDYSRCCRELSSMRDALRACLQKPFSPQNSTDLKNSISSANIALANAKSTLNKAEKDTEPD